MLWSLTKVLLFVGILIALAFGFNFLWDAEGGVQLAVAGLEFNLGPIESVVAALVVFAFCWFILKVIGFMRALWHFMNGDETAVSRFLSFNPEGRGYKALEQSMMAIATGEGRQALAKAEKASRLLNKPELTNLLTAQAAEVAGDRKMAEETYRKMVKNEKTRFVGVRGIMKQKLADGDTETAFKLAQRAFALKPRHVETQDTLLKMQAQKSDWGGARTTLNAKLKYGALPRDVYKRRQAVLALSEAGTVLDESQSIEAREAAIEANRLSPDLIPAAVMAARTLIGKGQKKQATRILRKAWETQPHPDLAAAFAEIEPNESAQNRVARFKPLTTAQIEHPETRMLTAELLIAAEDFPSARRALGNLFEEAPSARAAALMAAVERGSGEDDNVVQGWLARAVTAPRGPQWVCDNCQHIHGGWQPVCENCEAFDTLSWRAASEAPISLPGGAEMLPLLVGKNAGAGPVSTEVNAAEDTVIDVTKTNGVAPEKSAQP